MRPTGRADGRPYCLLVINSRSGDVPAYVRLADTIRDDIRTGRLRPGQPIPSERTLEQQFKLGRHTVRAAIRLLRAEGAVTVVRGIGTVVRDPEVMQELTPPSGAVAVARMPTAAERAELDLDEGVPVIEVTSDGEATVYAADRYRLSWP